MPVERAARAWVDAIDPKAGLTFGELRRFVTEGMRADVPDEAVVKVDMTWRGTPKRIHVQGVELSDQARVNNCAKCDEAALLPRVGWVVTAAAPAGCEHETKDGRR